MKMHHADHPDPDLPQRYHPCCPVPNRLPAFPDAVRVRPKDGRVRWKDRDGALLEWESRDAALEMYGSHGWHLGEFDHVLGGNLRVAEPGRRVAS